MAGLDDGSEEAVRARWAGTVVRVRALLPHAYIPDGDLSAPDTPQPIGQAQRVVTSAVVDEYLTQAFEIVYAAVTDYLTLPLSTERRGAVDAAARYLINHWAASATEAARYPERAGDPQGYAQVLWARYQDGLAALIKKLDGWLEEPPTDDAGVSLGRPRITVRTPSIRDEAWPTSLSGSW